MATNHETPQPREGHIPVPRAWAVALDPAAASFKESEHLLICSACSARVQRAMTALAARREARERYEAALVLLAALVKTHTRRPFALPRPAVTGFETGPAHDDGFVTYDFDDPDLTAGVERTGDGRYLLHIEHPGRKPGDLLLAVVRRPDDPQPAWARFVMLRPGYRHPEATARLDEAALPGDHYQLYLDVVAAPPPEAADLLRASLQDARADDPPAVAAWQAWAEAALKAGAGDPLRPVLEEISDAPPAAPAAEPWTELSS
jgi:hypothetical protein